MIESKVQTRVPASKVWQAWKKAHSMDANFVPGKKGALKAPAGGRFSYRVLEVIEGECFTILWKSLFVRLIFTHRVVATLKGSEIIYRIRFGGLFAWPVRFFLKEKIRSNLSVILKSLVKDLEAS